MGAQPEDPTAARARAGCSRGQPSGSGGPQSRGSARPDGCQRVFCHPSIPWRASGCRNHVPGGTARSGTSSPCPHPLWGPAGSPTGLSPVRTPVLRQGAWELQRAKPLASDQDTWVLLQSPGESWPCVDTSAAGRCGHRKAGSLTHMKKIMEENTRMVKQKPFLRSAGRTSKAMSSSPAPARGMLTSCLARSRAQPGAAVCMGSGAVEGKGWWPEPLVGLTAELPPPRPCCCRRVHPLRASPRQSKARPGLPQGGNRPGLAPAQPFAPAAQGPCSPAVPPSRASRRDPLLAATEGASCSLPQAKRR